MKAKSRDNSRTPVQWNGEENAGFTAGTPWIPVPDNYKEINAEEALNDPDSIFYHYKKLNELRKEFDIITTGDYQLILEDDQELYAYLRNGADEKLLVINNFTGKRPSFPRSQRRSALSPEVPSPLLSPPIEAHRFLRAV